MDIDEKNLSKEILAYSMPGVFANMADPRWEYAPHLALIEDKFLEILSGKPLRLLVSMPPRSGKSMFFSTIVPSWFLGRFPDKKVLLVTYQANFSKSFGRRARNILTEYGQQVFGVTVDNNTAAADHWEISGHTGVMDTEGAGGALTGKGADLLIIDDPIKGREMALSQKVLDDQWDWWGSDVRTRLEPGASIVIIATRWSNDDLIGKLIGQMDNGGEQWDVISLPALAEEDDVLGRRVGEPLWPKRFDVDALKNIRSNMNDYWWFALYQQRPASLEGNLIQIRWFRRFKDMPRMSDADQIIMSLDTAQKEKEVSDYTVIGVWFRIENNYYLVDVIRERLNHPHLILLTKNMISKWLPNAVLIEDKGSGISLIQHLQEETSAPIIPIEPTTDKVMRMIVETPMIETGQVLLPESGTTDWISDYEEEIRTFPNSARKDQVDMTSQTLRWIRERSVPIDLW